MEGVFRLPFSFGFGGGDGGRRAGGRGGGVSEGSRGRLLGAEFDDFGDALVLALLLHLPVAESFFFLGNLIVVVLDALGVVGGDAIHLGLNLGVLGGFAGFEFFELFLLAGFVGVESLLAAGGVLKQIVGGSAGGIEGHEDGGALDVGREGSGCGRC